MVVTLKADMARDIDETFLNLEEFAEPRRVGNRLIPSIFYETAESAVVDESGRAMKSYTLQIRESDLPNVRAGDALTVDGRAYHVANVRRDYGMTVLELVYTL